jgi:secondary thiamine-phosphate synthase enzyme
MQYLALRTLSLATKSRSEMVDITPMVKKALPTGLVSGFAIIYVPHTTAGVTINENADPDVKSDLLKKLETLVPKQESYYQHGEGNSDSHVKTALVGNSATVLVDNGRLLLGQWQGIYFCEFDGPRERTVMVQMIRNGPGS